MHIPRLHIKIWSKWQNTFFDLTSTGMCRGENVFSTLKAITPKAAWSGLKYFYIFFLRSAWIFWHQSQSRILAYLIVGHSWTRVQWYKKIYTMWKIPNTTWTFKLELSNTTLRSIYNYSLTYNNKWFQKESISLLRLTKSILYLKNKTINSIAQN